MTQQPLIAGEIRVDAPEAEKTGKLIEDMEMSDYHAFGDFTKHPDDYVLSKSMLIKLVDCPARFRYEYMTEKEEVEKDHLNVGTAVHTLALEPEKFDDLFYKIPEGMRRDKRTDEYKRCMAEAGTRSMLTHKDYQNILGMAEALSADPLARALFDGPGYIESSIFFTHPETRLRLRVRPDWFRKDGKLIINIKTSHSANPNLFNDTAANFCYDIGAAMELMAVEQIMGPDPERNYVLMVIEPSPPHVISVFDTIRPMTLDNDYDNTRTTYAEAGRARLEKALSRFIECYQNNDWPGYVSGVDPMRYPGWMMKRVLETGEV